jgi:uncharacterized protein YpmS
MAIKSQKNNNWKIAFFILLIVGTIFTFAMITNSYNRGYTDAGIEWSESMNKLGDSSTEILSQTLNETINDFSKNCIKYMCENVFDANYLENEGFGKCDGEEYKSVGALEECSKILFGE